MKLYEYTQDYLQLLEKADEIDQEVLIDTISSIQESVEDKAENIAKLVRTFEADGKTIKSEEERLAAKRKTLENQVLYLKKYLFEQLEAMDIQKIKRPLFTIAIQNNPPSVDVLDETIIPEKYWIKQEPKLNKIELLGFLKIGEPIPGVSLKYSKGLRIR